MATDTKAKHARVSYLPTGLSKEIKSMLKQEGIVTRRDERISRADAYMG
ncbi:MAG: hypothetical protein ACYSUD_00020 [Planctomycetota bacterium]|jgi:hypothetical protein